MWWRLNEWREKKNADSIEAHVIIYPGVYLTHYSLSDATTIVWYRWGFYDSHHWHKPCSRDDIMAWKRVQHYSPFVMGIRVSGSNVGLLCFRYCQSEQPVEQTVNLPVIWDAMTLTRRHCPVRRRYIGRLFDYPLASLSSADLSSHSKNAIWWWGQTIRPVSGFYLSPQMSWAPCAPRCFVVSSETC